MIAHQSYKYAESVIKREIAAPKYVIKQCEEFIQICDGNSEKYFLDEEELRQIDKVLKMLVMPRGLKAGCSIYCSCGYQWLFYAAILCVVHRENPDRRRYETAILEIARKNFKTFTIATIFVLLFFGSEIQQVLFSGARRGFIARSENSN